MLPIAAQVVSLRKAGRTATGIPVRRRKTKSEVAREILVAGLGGEARDLDLAQEARRQSLLVSRRRSERETLELVEQTADTQGWK